MNIIIDYLTIKFLMPKKVLIIKFAKLDLKHIILAVNKF